MHQGFPAPASLSDIIDDGVFRQQDIDRHTAGPIAFEPGSIWIGKERYDAHEVARVSPDHRWHWTIEPPFGFLANQTTVSDELLRACRTLYGNGPAYLIPLPGGPEEGHLVVVASGKFPASSFREQVAFGLARAPYSNPRRALWAFMADGGHPYREVSPTLWQLHDGTQVDFNGPTLVGDRTLHEVVADGFFAAKEAHFFQEANLASLGAVTREPVGRLLGNGTMVITHPAVEAFAVKFGVLGLLQPMPTAFLPAVQRILNLWGVAAEGDRLSLFRMEIPPLTSHVFDTVTNTPLPPGVDAARALRAYRDFRGPASAQQPQVTTPPAPQQDPRLAGGYVQQTIDLTQAPQQAANTPQPTTPHVAPIPPAPAQPATPAAQSNTPVQPQWAQASAPVPPVTPQPAPSPAPAPVEGTMQLPSIDETRQIPLGGVPPLPPASPAQTGVPATPVAQPAPAEPTVQLPPVEETRQILLPDAYPARPSTPAPTPPGVGVHPGVPTAPEQSAPSPAPVAAETPAALPAQPEQGATTGAAPAAKVASKARNLRPFRAANPLAGPIGMAAAAAATGAPATSAPEAPAAAPVESAPVSATEPPVQLSSIVQSQSTTVPAASETPVVPEAQPANAFVGIDPQPAGEDILAPAALPEESPTELTVQLPSMAQTQQIRRLADPDAENRPGRTHAASQPSVEQVIPTAPSSAAPQAHAFPAAGAPVQTPASFPPQDAPTSQGAADLRPVAPAPEEIPAESTFDLPSMAKTQYIPKFADAQETMSPPVEQPTGTGQADAYPAPPATEIPAPASVNRPHDLITPTHTAAEATVVEPTPAQPEVELPSAAKTEFIPKIQETQPTGFHEEAIGVSKVSPEPIAAPLLPSAPEAAETVRPQNEVPPTPPVAGPLPVAGEEVATPAQPEADLPSTAQAEFIPRYRDAAASLPPAKDEVTDSPEPVSTRNVATAWVGDAPVEDPTPTPEIESGVASDSTEAQPEVELPSAAQTEFIPKLRDVEPSPEATGLVVESSEPLITPIVSATPAPAQPPLGPVVDQPIHEAGGVSPSGLSELEETPAQPEVELPSMAQTQYIPKLAEVAKPIIPAVKHINPFVDPLPQPAQQAPAFPAVAPKPQVAAQPEPPATSTPDAAHADPVVDLPSMAQTQHIHKLGDIAEPVVRAVKHVNPYLDPEPQPEAPATDPAEVAPPAEGATDEPPVLPSMEDTHHIPVQRDQRPETT